MIKTSAFILAVLCASCTTENIPLPLDNGHKRFAIGCNDTGVSGCEGIANDDCPLGFKVLLPVKSGEWKMVIECLDDGKPQ